MKKLLVAALIFSSLIVPTGSTASYSSKGVESVIPNEAYKVGSLLNSMSDYYTTVETISANMKNAPAEETIIFMDYIEKFEGIVRDAKEEVKSLKGSPEDENKLTKIILTNLYRKSNEFLRSSYAKYLY